MASDARFCRAPAAPAAAVRFTPSGVRACNCSRPVSPAAAACCRTWPTVSFARWVRSATLAWARALTSVFAVS